MNKLNVLLASLIVLAISSINGFSQKSVIPLGDDRSLELGGWVRSEFNYNSRETVNAVDGLFSLYPLQVTPDDNGKDINGYPSVTMSSITTRFSTAFRGVNIGNAATEAYVEVDFSAKSTANSINFRQGWIKFLWDDAQLLVGRTWHPMSSSIMPHVKNFNTGAPFFTFNRSEQLRYTYLPGNFTFSATASYQGSYNSFGPAGQSDIYMRRALVPEISIVAMWQDESYKAGVVGNTKTIQPRALITGTNGLTTSTNEKLTTFSAQVFGEILSDYMSLRLNGSYTQNNAESAMLGGYAVSVYNSITGFEEYTTSQHLNGWISVEMGDKLKYGFFAGHSKNLGTLDPIVGSYYGRGNNIASISRISPHISYQLTKLTVSTELEFTQARYGTRDNADFGKVKNTSPANNTRFLLQAVYYF